MKLLHILNPRAFLIPTLQDFLLKALAHDQNEFAADALIELQSNALNPNVALYVTVDEQNRYTGMAVVASSTTALSPGCVVLQFYNERASAPSRKLLIYAIREFARLHGHTRIRGNLISGRGAAFGRLFKDLGRPIPRGVIYEYDFSEDESNG